MNNNLSRLSTTLIAGLLVATSFSSLSAQPGPREERGRNRGEQRPGAALQNKIDQAQDKVDKALDKAADKVESATQPVADAVAPSTGVAEWIVDPVHSSIVFNIGHNGISRVYGSFQDFSGIIKFSAEDLGNSSIEVSVKTASVNTNNEGRDKHVSSGDYLKSETAEFATFKSSSITAVDADTFKATGDLEIAGVKTPVSFDFDLTGTMTDKRGATRVGAATTFKIDRTAYSIGKPEGLSPDVELIVDLQAVKQ